jgi:glycosyltransferase domain-containing protein
MNIEELYTLIIPTYNRQELFKQLIDYFTASKAKFKILVLDSSYEPYTHNNKILCDKSGLNIEHIIYDKKITGSKKFYDGLKRVTTRYGSFCFDDDFSTVRGIKACVEFLENNPDYVSVQGFSILFTVLGKDNIEIQDKKYAGHKIDGVTAAARLDQLFVNYVQQLCSVFRTDILRLAFDCMENTKNGILAEIGSAIIPSIFGKHKVLPVFYSARRHLFKASESYTVEMPRFEILKPEGLKDYEQWRNEIAKIYSKEKGVTINIALTIIEKAFNDFNAWDLRTFPNRKPISEVKIQNIPRFSFRKLLKKYIPAPFLVLKRKLYMKLGIYSAFSWPDSDSSNDWKQITDIINGTCSNK